MAVSLFLGTPESHLGLLACTDPDASPYRIRGNNESFPLFEVSAIRDRVYSSLRFSVIYLKESALHAFRLHNSFHLLVRFNGNALLSGEGRGEG